ncbi:zinc finger protein OZF-like [Penaeus chinensis]|uniref:zinc finger protein OZF-like n=1 Tax=Penaeus chinensis TaxID=139456 RepID=UPI001FB7948D|nr:zinc finger protein OZF-like [Penaeus chinensis]XP_047486174.1 zinc finger protein OZF-like [Penaeus chinensis]XP_047486175.1 zinc finger protein OZF-like [Penaeus chinensis]XP_047486176.1 zinc finger protein OZF-like [Penaeus chinensis]XP_047486177.1 zinc finger protein OZF-like [Penaeus chinensis]XP_047486178.1 zinc finger protein OZF-like [Penaeus chinensis]
MSFLSEWMPLAPPSDDEIYNQEILIKEKVKEEIKKENDLEIQEENDLEIKEEKDLEIKEESLDYEMSDADLKHDYPSSMGSKSIREEENGRNSYEIIEDCNDASVTTPLVADHCDTMQTSDRHKEGEEEAAYQKPCSQRVKAVEQNEVDTNKPHTCEICCKAYASKYRLHNHIRDIHTKEKPYKCEACNKTFTVNRKLVIHRKMECEYKWSPDNNQTAKDGSKEKSEKESEVWKCFTCEVCSKKFPFKRGLLTHMRVHTKEKPFKCEVCATPFARKTDISNHMKTHTRERSYVCDICSKGFSRKSHLDEHIKRVHLKERPFKCKICNKSFFDNSLLRDHMSIHTEEDPFKCEICHKNFSRKNSLKLHMKRHVGVKSFICEVCSKAFLNKHTLGIHMRVHTGEKPYTCKVCNKTFRALYTLTKHSRLHTREKQSV